MANTFTSIIKCDCCGYKYRHIKENGKSKYFCYGYSKSLPNSCKVRSIVDEEILLDIVQIYCNRNKLELIKTNQFMKGIIDIILVDEHKNITIHYKNGENGIYHKESVHI